MVWNTLSWPRTPGHGQRRPQRRRTGLGTAGARRAAGPAADSQQPAYSDGALLRAEFAFVARDLPALGYAVYRVLPLKSPAACRPRRRRPGRRPRKRVLPGPVRPRHRRDHQPDPERRPVECPKRPRKRRGRGAGSRRFVGTLSSRGRGKMLRDGGPAPGAAAGQGGLQHRLGRHAGHACSAAPSSPNWPSRRTLRPARQLRHRGAALRRPAPHRHPHHGPNQDKLVRYRVLFPTSIPKGRSVHEIPFGAIERPDGIEMPAQTGSITAMAATAWPCSTSGFPATTSPTGR